MDEFRDFLRLFAGQFYASVSAELWDEDGICSSDERFILRKWTVQEGELGPQRYCEGPLWAFTTGNKIVCTRRIGDPEWYIKPAPPWQSKIPVVGYFWKRPLPRDRLAFLDPETLEEVATTRPFGSEVLAVALSHDGAVLVAATKEGLYVFDVPQKFR